MAFDWRQTTDGTPPPRVGAPAPTPPGRAARIIGMALRLSMLTLTLSFLLFGCLMLYAAIALVGEEAQRWACVLVGAVSLMTFAQICEAWP